MAESCDKSTQQSAFSAQFSYDGKGNRLKAIRNGVTTKYVYDMSSNVLAEADGNNNIQALYIYGNGRLLAMVTPDDQVYSYHFNAIGSTVAVTDQGQNVVNKYAYDSFGSVLNQVESIPQPFKYVGQYGVIVEQNGLYKMGYRYYDPKTGRFISEDPIGFESGTVNLYEYVGGNPVNRNDPTGLTDRYELCDGNIICKKVIDCACKFGKEYCCKVDYDGCMNDAASDDNITDLEWYNCWSNYWTCVRQAGIQPTNPPSPPPGWERYPTPPYPGNPKQK